jgi:hypothetical protein
MQEKDFRKEERKGKRGMIHGGGQALGEEMVRRVLEEASLREKQREETQYVQDMLDTLQELTGLTEAELESIIIKVRHSPVPDRDSFFSVTHQAILASAFLGMFLFLPALCIWMVC